MCCRDVEEGGCGGLKGWDELREIMSNGRDLSADRQANLPVSLTVERCVSLEWRGGPGRLAVLPNNYICIGKVSVTMLLAAEPTAPLVFYAAPRYWHPGRGLGVKVVMDDCW